MALQLMPHLLTRSLEAERDGRDALILTATSGDTGKAALEGFSDVPGVEVAVFYPARGVGEVPRLQMATHPARNTHVFAVDGNFDDTQTGVKRIFADPELAALAAGRGAFLSSANSINIGRLVPQVVYYLYAYLELLRTGALTEEEAFRIAVPTGNFGNILAAWYAARMGVPVCRLLCASNQNHILTDFFATGRYDLHRDFHKTLSPSMDILISSNLERLLFELLDRDDATCADLMAQLADGRQYSLPERALSVAGRFSGHWAGDAETTATIGRVFAQEGYCIDPHTAVAFSAADALPEQGVATLIVSTASPFKFPAAVLGGLGLPASADEFDNIDRLSRKIGAPVPQSLAALRHAVIRFDQVYTQGQMRSAVADLLSHRTGRS